MKDLVLILSMLAIFVFGYFLMKKVDEFITENQRRIATESRAEHCKVRIAAENAMLLNCVTAALEVCSEANPCMEFFFSSGKPDRLLQKLSDETMDLVLLSENSVESLQDNCAFVKIPCEGLHVTESALGLPIENLDEENYLYVVWNKQVKSKNRDRVIFTLENEYCRM